MASTKYIDVRKGQVIVGADGQLYAVVDREHITPGNWRAILNLKLKNLNTGSTAVNRVKPEGSKGDPEMTAPLRFSPAPVGQQGPPTRVAAFDSWRSLRDAHGPSYWLRGRPTSQRERAFATARKFGEASVATLTQALTT